MVIVPPANCVPSLVILDGEMRTAVGIVPLVSCEALSEVRPEPLPLVASRVAVDGICATMALLAVVKVVCVTRLLCPTTARAALVASSA